MQEYRVKESTHTQLNEYKHMDTEKQIKTGKKIINRKDRYNASLSRDSTFLDTSPLSHCPPPNAPNERLVE